MPAQVHKGLTPTKSAIRKTSPSSSLLAQNGSKSESPHPTHHERKKSKKRRVDQTAPAVESSSSMSLPAEAEVVVDVATRKKSIMKRKREAQTDGADQDDSSTPKKHKAIFSKFEKSSKLAEEARKTAVPQEAEPEKEEDQLHDLEPLPQPAPVPEPVFNPTYSTLPTWLAKPVTIESSKTVPFDTLGVQSLFLKKLEKQGYKEALAVQSALLPMLHPGLEQHLGDICVSAKTGSGKTLAYLLPVVEALKDRVTPTLSAIVVVPSRQLVDQALQVAEELCSGTKLKVGTAVGNVPFAAEQKHLVRISARYRPQRAQELQDKAARQLESGFMERSGILADMMNMPIDHVPHYESSVDILICTPGRLVEHIDSTTGFLLRSVRWLVIDEADQLLNQDFQGWANILMDALHGDTPEDFLSMQEQLRKRRRGSKWSAALSKQKELTKIVLSATMESDLTKLGTLRLKRPRLVVVKDDTKEVQSLTSEGSMYELPSTLDEYAIRVGDGSNKPLYLLYLLLHHIFKDENTTTDVIGTTPEDASTDSSDDSDSESSASDSEEENESHKTNPSRSISRHKGRVLIFTKSNENASRLSHLLSMLQPDLKDYIKTMSPSSTAKASKKTLRSFSAGTTKILIASDAASRGLDVPDITHVINYDIPSSVTSYVHRVGRTARAGKAGEAWTLFTKSEAAWFLNVLTRGDAVRRGPKTVQRVWLAQRDVTWDRRRTYKEALQKLQGAVGGAADG
ncbi:P-loop containing nucleoside triphosphate hydrolase protein [Massariosphaeria phaeospora]|uniref:ATP-dependent RNA helicase n=1 Tax=Massariosphaeria phaeospora TaxID=100035 RepID=A0A7C8MCB8_9PLEO|nr:P-loop containing nucleoside triphosphate hydrolase protein [Massariosphaeria phaeospora]